MTSLAAQQLTELESLAALTSVSGLGAMKIRLLRHHFGSAQKALEAPAAEWAQLPGFRPVLLDALEVCRREGAWCENLELVEKWGVKLISMFCPDYPKRLLELTDPPVLLYVRGKLKPQDHNGIAVIGTRNATVYGKEMARAISRDLAASGHTVVSGLARGIDVSAHEGALETGRTIAVIGSGLANIYPREHSIISEWIVEHGALISEFPMKTPPDRPNFPQRNRIVSGMTLATLLIEAPLQSGAMMTVSKALAQNRPVFALPGRADIDSFRGNHLLIKEGVAKLIENARDLLNSFDSLFTYQPALPPAPNIPTLEPEEEQLLSSMNEEEISVDELAERSLIPVARLNVLLMSLVLKKAVKEFPGKLFKKK